MKMYVSAAGFARSISRDNKTVTNWIRKGLIPNVRRLGNRFQIPIEEIEKAKTLPEYPLRDRDLQNYESQNSGLSTA